MKDKTPTYTKNFRIPYAHKEEISKQVENLVKHNIIEPSVSEYNSPILLVPKKSLPGNTEKRWKLVVDYRNINKKLTACLYGRHLQLIIMYNEKHKLHVKSVAIVS